MAIEFGEDIKRLLDAPNFAHLSTLMPDGSPKVEPTWVGREGNYVRIATDSNSVKGKNIALDKRVALSVTNGDNPYEQVLIRGKVVETREDNDLQVLDAFSQQYLGREYPRRKWSARVVYVIEAEVARYYVSPIGKT